VSAGFQVILDDLMETAQSFVNQASTFHHISTVSSTLHSPDTGDDTLNQALTEALQRFSLVAEEFSQKIAQNGYNLRDAHDNYQQTDADVQWLWEKLTSESGSDS
jgi:hypothetical protein